MSFGTLAVGKKRSFFLNGMAFIPPPSCHIKRIFFLRFPSSCGNHVFISSFLSAAAAHKLFYVSVKCWTSCIGTIFLYLFKIRVDVQNTQIPHCRYSFEFRSISVNCISRNFGEFRRFLEISISFGNIILVNFGDFSQFRRFRNLGYFG